MCSSRSDSAAIELVRRPAAGDVQRPHRAQAPVGVDVIREHPQQFRARRGPERSPRGSSLEDDARAACVPVAPARLQRHELGVAHRPQVRVAARPVGRVRLGGRNPEDPAGLVVQDIGAADVGVVPVEHVESAVGADLDAEPHPLGVVRHHEVFAVTRGEARSLPLEHVRQHRVLVDVGHEDAAPLRGREGIGLIDARAAVSRAVTMVGDGLNVAVDVRVEVPAALTLVDAAGNDVPEMRDHAGAHDQLTLGVVVDAPRVAEAVRHDLEAILGRMVAPDAAVDVDPLA